MSIRKLIIGNRSFRRFHQNEPVETKTLRQLVDLARMSASAANLQPLKYILTCEADRNASVFPHLYWARYLGDWPGPPEGERPSAYIIVLLDHAVSKTAGCDHGIAAQSILLGAAEMGLGGCMIESIKRDGLRAALDLGEQYEILLVIALGKPKEKVRLESVGADGDIQYWRDEDGVHHVPKRSLDDIILS
jgi:nitroreductase